MLLQDLKTRDLIDCPKWLPDNTQCLVQMGSVAYGVSNDSSDMDVYGFCMPPRELVFPHLTGEIIGFGQQIKRFDQWQQHHIKVPDWRKEYDFSVYSIVRFFHLCMENNPNMINAMFVPRRCILHSTQIAEVVRENRKMFLHKGAWHKFKGYAYAQMQKMRNKSNASNEKRAADIARVGYDTKFAYHIVRLLGEVEQIMVEHDLDIERNREQLKSIRRGDWTLEQIEGYFADKEKALEEVYLKSDLRYSPDEDAIRELLLNCLEAHYGSLSAVVQKDVSVERLLSDLRALVEKHGG